MTRWEMSPEGVARHVMGYPFDSIIEGSNQNVCDFDEDDVGGIVCQALLRSAGMAVIISA